MKRLLFVLLLCVIAVNTRTAQSAEEIIQLALSLEPDHTLPGIPTALKLIAMNRSSSPVRLPEAIVLSVVPAKGDAFVAKTGQGHYGWLDDEYIVEPGQSKEIFFGVGPVAYSGWFVDPRLSWPGVYGLQITMDRDPDPRLVDGVLQKDPGEPRKIVSTVATLTVELPKSEDSLVWDRLLVASKGKGWGADRWFHSIGLAREIVDNHPTSNYVPLVASFANANSDDERIEICERVISMFPSSRGIDRVYGTLALLYTQKMYKAFKKKDLALARKLYDKKTEHLKLAIAKTKDPKLKDEAEKMMHSWDHEYQVRYVNWFKEVE